jgi:hypothetical protein
MADEESKGDSGTEKTDPWGRIEGIIRKVVGEELSKWETESPNNSQPSGEGKTEESPQSEEPSKSSTQPRKTGFLSKAFGILE